MRDVSNSDLEVSDTNPIPYNSFFFLDWKEWKLSSYGLRSEVYYFITRQKVPESLYHSVRVAKGWLYHEALNIRLSERVVSAI